jgi:hypothetical protein
MSLIIMSGKVKLFLCVTPGEIAPGTHLLGGWVNLRASLDDLEKRKFLTLPGLEQYIIIQYNLQNVPVYIIFSQK